jgi:hypothetical protein
VLDCFKEYPDFSNYYQRCALDRVQRRLPSLKFQVKGPVCVGGFDHDYWVARVRFDSDRHQGVDLEIEHWVHFKELSDSAQLSVPESAYTGIELWGVGSK